MKHIEILNDLCRRPDELYARGNSFGGNGNLSVRIDDTIWVTPTGVALKDLEPSTMAGVDLVPEGIAVAAGRQGLRIVDALAPERGTETDATPEAGMQ